LEEAGRSHRPASLRSGTERFTDTVRRSGERPFKRPLRTPITRAKMSYTDALARISQISAEAASLRAAFSAPVAAAAPAAASSSSAATAAESQAAASFSTALASALSDSSQGSPLSASLYPALPASLTVAPAGAALGTGGEFSAGAGLAAVGMSAGGAVGVPAAGAVGVSAAGAGIYSGGALAVGAGLPASASTLLTPGQQQFASRLAADTGLDPGVVTAWLLAEESGGAAASRQAAGNNDWLNIGYTDSGTYGASDAVWSDPITAADATAGWLSGQSTIPGYGTASPGIQAILQTAGQGPAAQIQALQSSGWASSGYPDLPSIYQQVLA